jgi:multidrug efflux pump subunit AcrB
LRGDDAVLNITAATDVTAIADFREMVIKRGASTDHGIVRLKDIATLELGGQNYNSSARSNGERSVVIALSPTPDGNPLNIVAHAKKLIPEIQKTAPPGLVIESAFDVTHFVNASISEVQKTLLEALVIVVLVIFLFLGSLRAVVIPIVTIPLSMVGTAALMLALGFSINLLTLLAMVLAIGLVVDDAIVVVQNQLFGMANSVHGASVTPFQPAALPAAAEGLPFQMVLRSPGDFKTLYEDAEKLKAAIFQSGLFVFVDSDLAFDNPSAHVRIDAAKAGELGITMQAIADTLNTLVGENYINRFNYFARSYDVIPQVQKTHRLTPDNIRRYYVRTISNELVPLSTVVNVEVAAQPNKLSQFNQMNSATLSAVIRPGVTMGQAVAFIEGQTLSPGVAIDWMADSRQYVKEGNQLTVSFGLALIVIFLVLAAQYESFRDPLVILVTVPLAMFGALIPLFLDFTTVNIYTQIGLVTLIGLISKHGILMVAFANEIQTTKGYNRHAAIIEAASVRLRPILMTTAAMVAGLVPLIFANGAGAASRFAIGIVVVMGMLIGTLFTLFVLPTFYTLLARDHRPLGAINADAVRGETGRLAAFGTGPFPLV